MKPFLPGARVGVMGGGQLGRMFAIAARRMGYRVHTFSPEEDSPTGQLADVEIVSRYEDMEAVERFACGIDVLTFEFENIPAETVEQCSRFCEVRPSGQVLYVAQNRLREKRFLSGAGLPVAAFREISSLDQLRQAAAEPGLPGVLKSASFGYDGKGQRKVEAADDLEAVWASYAGAEAVFEKFVRFSKEISVIVARDVEGEMAAYPVCENLHANHILDVTTVPADVPESVSKEATDLAMDVAREIDLIGVLAVEMFLQEDGTLLVNEIAPRPHNSGHFSFDACVTSQFEQQLRAVCGLNLGSTELLRPAAMANLLGDLWENGEPDWAAAAAFPDVKIHLYGKAEPRPGRKMGHLVGFGSNPSEAREAVIAARARLARRSI